MSELKRRIEGGALSYAIVVVLLLGLFSSSLLFISKANQQLSRIAEMKEHLIFNNAFHGFIFIRFIQKRNIFVLFTQFRKAVFTF